MREETRYVDDVRAANYIGWSPQHLRNLRSRGEGPPYIKNSRSVRYDLNDLDAWMESRKIRPRQ